MFLEFYTQFLVTIIREGRITDDDLIGPLQGKPLSALIEHMRKEHTFVNIHTEEQPQGIICGEVRLFEGGKPENE